MDYRVSMGVYGLSRTTLDGYTPGPPLGFDELVLDLLEAQDPPHAYDFDGYWLDIGRPDDYDRANAEYLATARTDGLAKTLASAAPDAVINCAGSTDGDAVTLSSTVCPRRSYRSPCAPRANAARRSAVP